MVSKRKPQPQNPVELDPAQRALDLAVVISGQTKILEVLLESYKPQYGGAILTMALTEFSVRFKHNGDLVEKEAKALHEALNKVVMNYMGITVTGDGYYHIPEPPIGPSPSDN